MVNGAGKFSVRGIVLKKVREQFDICKIVDGFDG